MQRDAGEEKERKVEWIWSTARYKGGSEKDVSSLLRATTSQNVRGPSRKARCGLKYIRLINALTARSLTP